MADDLIPPPSPAGRPDPEGTRRDEPFPRQGGGLWSGEAGRGGLWSGSPDGADAEEEATRRRPAVAITAADPAHAAPEVRREAEAFAGSHVAPSPFRSRFALITGALAGLGLVAIVAAVVAIAGSGGGIGAGDWSPWQPTAEDKLTAAQQIADHVGRHYRLGDGDQLVAVASSDLEISDVPLDVAVRTAANGGDIRLIEGNGVMYTLNGLGPHGAIAEGTPSEERHLLLRREALELALYTFRYVDDVDIVVALLPPSAEEVAGNANAATQALFYRPGDLKSKVQVPLEATLSPVTPRPETLPMGSPEAKRVDALTRGNLFLASFQQGQNAAAYLVLDRPAG